MSLMLTGYSEYGCQEFIFPEKDNADHSVFLDRSFFGIPEDVELLFDVMDGQWRFQGTSDNAAIGPNSARVGEGIKAGDMIYVLIGAMHIAIVVMEFTPDVGGLQKYSLSLPCQITIGSDQDNQIICSNNPFISRHHVTLFFDKYSCTVNDQSTNGTFIDGRRIHGMKSVPYGTCVSFFGVQLVWLGDIIAIGSKCGEIQCTLRELPPSFIAPVTSNSREDISPKQFFRRSPRNLPTLYKEKIEVEAPPQPQRISKRPLLLTIGPSLTMAIPMVVGTLIAILASQSNGASASVYMYTGIIIAILSALIGSTWTLINMRFAKKQEIANEILRVQKYKDYIFKIENQIAEKYEYNKQSLNYIYPASESCAHYDRTSSELWNRNSTHEDFLFARLGIGAILFHCPIVIPKEKFSLVDDELAIKPQELQDKFWWLKNVPVGINLRDKRLVGVVSQHREQSANILRNLVIQIASSICYTDLKMVFLFDGGTPSEYSSWSFARWLPHTWSTDHKIRYFAADATERSEVCFSLANVMRSRAEQGSGAAPKIIKPYYIVFVANPDLLEGEPVAKYLLASENNLGVTTILFAERFEQLPNNCVDIIRNDAEFCGTLNTELGETSRQQISFDDIDAEMADSFARNLSTIEVRETEVGGDVPDTLSFLEMYHVHSVEELNADERWLKNRTYENMRVPIGQKAGGITWNLDIHEKYHGPHGLVAGTTGSGKSETLQTYILSLAVNFSPNDVAFFLIDFKGGGMANLFANLPHTAGYISNLSGNQIHRAMVSIKSENRRRQKILGEFGLNHIDQYTRLLKNGEATQPMPHLFIIIDEFAELKREEPDFMRELISVAQVGRSLGVHLILATQKPNGIVDDNIWSNTRFRLCLRVQDRQDSNDVLHKPDAAYLTQAGRCYMQVGNDEIYEVFQSGWSGAIYDEDPTSGHQELASIWSNTGKAGISGTGRLRHLEQKKKRWLSALLQGARNAAEVLGLSLVEATADKKFVSLLYQELLKAGYDYSLTPANLTRLLDFVQECAHHKAAGVSDSDTVVFVMSEFQSSGKQIPELKEKTQLAAVVDYLIQTTKNSLYQDHFFLWLPILPQEVYLFDVCRENMFDGEHWPCSVVSPSLAVTVGIYDDPANQTQEPLVIDLSSNGNLAICGSTVSGKSTFMQTLLYAFVNKYSPDQVNIYVLDYSNHLQAPFAELCHCGGVVFDNEPDKTEKLFVLLSDIIAERKRMFQGGSYPQFVISNGFTVPYIILAIDNYAGFREKTENKYESDLLVLSREGVSYGVFLVVTSGGFGAGELQNRIADNFRFALCLEMGDKFKYAEVLRTHHIDVLPESNVKGRGIANINGRVLEFQTALAFKASDDYARTEKLVTCFGEMNRSWHGKCARKIPTIPTNPDWDDFLTYIDTGDAHIRTDGLLPFGWNTRSASVVSIDLSRTYCWLISGKARTGKTNLLKVLASSAALCDSDRFIFDFAQKLQKFAEENQAKYISDSRSLFDVLKALIPQFKERNRKKQELIAAGYDEDEIYNEMKKYVPIYLFIDDLNDFLRVAYNPSEGVGSVSGFLENIAEKGYLHNIFIIAGLDQTKTAQSIGYQAFASITSYKAGIHLGGNVAAQRLFDFPSISYQEQTKVSKPGTGWLVSTDYESSAIEVVIPKLKG